MPLILAIEPDRRQASKIAALAKDPLRVELVVADSTATAFAALAGRVPDLILTSLLLSPKDENMLGDRLRELDAVGTKVQTLVIPVLATTVRRGRTGKGGLLTRLRGSKGKDAVPEGCDPEVFAEQITEYLERADGERQAAAVALEDRLANQQDPVYATRRQEAQMTGAANVGETAGGSGRPRRRCPRRRRPRSRRARRRRPHDRGRARRRRPRNRRLGTAARGSGRPGSAPRSAAHERAAREKAAACCCPRSRPRERPRAKPPVVKRPLVRPLESPLASRLPANRPPANKPLVTPPGSGCAGC